ncbi:MAG TPA: glycosyltransferase family 87 protein [Solirubrobacteraceae bacterium]|nr:glycosyltransferase family 87 protein [Solirubrobacteraceae bacterium]
MRDDQPSSEAVVTLSPGSLLDAPAALPPAPGHPRPPSAPRPRVRARPPLDRAGVRRTAQALRGARAGRWALGFILLATAAIVARAAGGASILVPRAAQAFAAWEAGPLHLIGLDAPSGQTLGAAFSGLLAAMLAAYAIVLAAIRTLPARVLVAAVVVVHLIVLLSPPMQLTDVFNYLGYARLGALHDLNPYRHVIAQELFDPVSTFATWDNLRSPYGWLFTALTYPLAFVSLPIAYWIIKIATVAVALCFVALVGDCARRLGRDWRHAVAFVALNPIYIVYALGGFHNDFLMLTPMLGSIWLMLAGRDRLSGAVLMLGVAIKFTAVLLAPFLLLAMRDRRRQVRWTTGAAAAAAALGALSLALFGPALPNLAQQSAVLTGTSIPNLFGLAAGIGGATPLLLKLAELGVVAVVAHQLLRGRDWLTGAGWATLALIASLGWLMPWYVVWLLPLAALAGGRRLRRVALALTVFLVLAFVPQTGYWMSEHGIQLLNTAAGRRALSLQDKLAG